MELDRDILTEDKVFASFLLSRLPTNELFEGDEYNSFFLVGLLGAFYLGGTVLPLNSE